MKDQFGIEVSVKLGKVASNGYLLEEFTYQRKVTGCVDIRDAMGQTRRILDDCDARLVQQVERMHPLLTNLTNEVEQ